jgi:hypothetical protein
MFSVAVNSAFLVALLFCFALQQPGLLVFGVVLCVLYALARWDFSSIDLYKLVALLFFICICFVSVFWQARDFVPVFYLFSMVFAIFAAERFSLAPLRQVRICLEIVFWIAVFGIACGLALYWETAEPLGELIPGSSTNGLPSYLIVVQVALSISVFLDKNKLPILSALATLIVALFGLGRGSIVVAFLIFLFSFFVNFFLAKSGAEKNTMVRLFFGFVFLSAALGAVSYVGYLGLVDEWVEGSRFSAGMLDSHRGYMLEDYLGKLDVWTSIFGADYSGTSINNIYGGNPHNSYIRLHSYYGIFALIVVAVSPFAVFATNKYFSCKCVFFVLVCLVLVRAATEPILFPTLLDFFYVLYFFIFWRHAPSRLPRWRQKCLKD